MPALAEGAGAGGTVAGLGPGLESQGSGTPAGGGPIAFVAVVGGATAVGTIAAGLAGVAAGADGAGAGAMVEPPAGAAAGGGVGDDDVAVASGPFSVADGAGPAAGGAVVVAGDAAGGEAGDAAGVAGDAAAGEAVDAWAVGVDAGAVTGGALPAASADLSAEQCHLRGRRQWLDLRAEVEYLPGSGLDLGGRRAWRRLRK